MPFDCQFVLKFVQLFRINVTHINFFVLISTLYNAFQFSIFKKEVILFAANLLKHELVHEHDILRVLNHSHSFHAKYQVPVVYVYASWTLNGSTWKQLGFIHTLSYRYFKWCIKLYLLCSKCSIHITRYISIGQLSDAGCLAYCHATFKIATYTFFHTYRMWWYVWPTSSLFLFFVFFGSNL